MKATGIIRRIDTLGRICIPKELRNNFKANEGQPFEIFTTENSIIFKKYEKGCKFCSSLENLTEFKNIEICNNCLNEIKLLNYLKGEK